MQHLPFDLLFVFDTWQLAIYVELFDFGFILQVTCTSMLPQKDISVDC